MLFLKIIVRLIIIVLLTCQFTKDFHFCFFWFKNINMCIKVFFNFLHMTFLASHSCEFSRNPIIFIRFQNMLLKYSLALLKLWHLWLLSEDMARWVIWGKSADWTGGLGNKIEGGKAQEICNFTSNKKLFHKKN